MKNKIKAALQQGQYKNLGLDEKAFEGVAAYLATSITDEAEIETKVNSDEVKALLKSFQSVADAARAKAKNEPNPQPTEPGKQPEPNPQDPPKPAEPQDLKAMLAEALAEVVNPLKEELATFKATETAKAALAAAESTFKSNDYVKKYADEATDAWERATEMYEATGKEWTAEELGTKAMDYFKKAVAKKGVDTTKPFQSDGGGGDGSFEASSWVQTMKDMGWEVPKEN